LLEVAVRRKGTQHRERAEWIKEEEREGKLVIWTGRPYKLCVSLNFGYKLTI
jgi:hypothetical protein